jgi:hypothetical protein
MEVPRKMLKREFGYVAPDRLGQPLGDESAMFPRRFPRGAGGGAIEAICAVTDLERRLTTCRLPARWRYGSASSVFHKPIALQRHFVIG